MLLGMPVTVMNKKPPLALYRKLSTERVRWFTRYKLRLSWIRVRTNWHFDELGGSKQSPMCTNSWERIYIAIFRYLFVAMPVHPNTHLLQPQAYSVSIVRASRQTYRHVKVKVHIQQRVSCDIYFRKRVAEVCIFFSITSIIRCNEATNNPSEWWIQKKFFKACLQNSIVPWGIN